MEDDIKVIQNYQAEIAGYRKVLEEIVQCSQVLQENPNCRYILNLAADALKPKSAGTGKGRRQLIG